LLEVVGQVMVAAVQVDIELLLVQAAAVARLNPL
jgi:hypothetical protein